MPSPVSSSARPKLTHVAAEEQVGKLLKEVGVTADKENLKQMIKALEGKTIPEHIRDGSAKMSSFSAGGASTAAAGKSPSISYQFPSHDCRSRNCSQGRAKERREKGGGHGRRRHGRPLRRWRLLSNPNHDRVAELLNFIASGPKTRTTGTYVVIAFVFNSFCVKLFYTFA